MMKKTNKKADDDGGFKNLLNPLDKTKEVWYNKYIKDRKEVVTMKEFEVRFTFTNGIYAETAEEAKERFEDILCQEICRYINWQDFDCEVEEVRGEVI